MFFLMNPDQISSGGCVSAHKLNIGLTYSILCSVFCHYTILSMALFNFHLTRPEEEKAV